MAMSNAEKVRRYRERKKAAHEAAPDLTIEFVKGKLSKFIHAQSRSSYADAFEFIENAVPLGLEFPEGFFNERHTYDVDDLVGGESSLSGKSLLVRMEALAGLFLDAASELHRTINNFKLEQIDARISEIEGADLSDAKAKARALQDIVMLQGIKSNLEGKTFRRSFAEISVKGSASD